MAISSSIRVSAAGHGDVDLARANLDGIDGSSVTPTSATVERLPDQPRSSCGDFMHPLRASFSSRQVDHHTARRKSF